MTAGRGSDRSDSGEELSARLNRINWDFRGYVPTSTAQGINALHWYPAPFPAALAGTLLDILLVKRGTYLDPFSGSGVGPMEAWIRGMRSYGVDSNSFAIRIASAKVHLLGDATAELGRSMAEDYIAYERRQRKVLSLENLELICSAGGLQQDAQRWFEPEALRDITIAKHWIEEAGGEWTATLRVLLSSLMHRASIARDVHYTYIVDRSRTTAPPKSRADLPSDFRIKLVRMFRDAEVTRLELLAAGSSLTRQQSPRFVAAKAQEIHRLIRIPVDLVVTSPPYFGMNDYVRSQYLSWLVDPWDEYESDIAIEAGSRRDRRSARKLDQYLAVMDDVFRGLAKVVAPGGYLALAIGQSQTQLAQKRDPLSALHAMICDAGFHPAWRRSRTVRFRKINNARTPVELLWIFER